MHGLAENFDPFSPLIFHLNNKKNQKNRKKQPLHLRGLDPATKIMKFHVVTRNTTKP